MSNRVRLVLSVLLFALAVVLAALPVRARVISYAPYTNYAAVPVYQSRMAGHFALLEGGLWYPPGILAPIPGTQSLSQTQVILYDAIGAEEPRLVFPQDAKQRIAVNGAAMRENSAHVVSMILQTTDDVDGTNPQRKLVTWMTSDSGVTWKKINIPEGIPQANYYMDFGGPYTRGPFSNIRLGTDQTPFVVGVYATTPTGGKIYAIDADGTVRTLVGSTAFPNNSLVGSNAAGTKFLVRDTLSLSHLSIVDLSGNLTTVADDLDNVAYYEGWITPDNSVYLLAVRNEGRFLYLYRNGTKQFIAGPFGATPPPPLTGSPYTSIPANTTAFAIPTADFGGAWIIQRSTGIGTTLSRHTPLGGLQAQWTDITAPEVEALHAGASGNTLLVQVHRPRLQPQRTFKDPALAVWTVGQPAPRDYDELFMDEQITKGFVHVDPDNVGKGTPFVFDSGIMSVITGAPPVFSPAPPSGGSDVLQEWGVVRASLKQQLVFPGAGRTPGAYGSFWQTDLVLQNPADEPQLVALQFVETGKGPAATDVLPFPPYFTTVTLAPREIRLVKDSIKTLFNLETATGALFVTPQYGINATSRTYTTTSAGTYGYSMNAVDVYTAASPRFPVSFSGAFPGGNFRTNLVLTDTSAHGTGANLQAVGVSGPIGSSSVGFEAPSAGQQQINGINAWLGLTSADAGGLVVLPTKGTLLASVFAIDNKTNDATYFPPDITATTARVIPVIGHVDGANNSRFRSDLYLYNASSTPSTVSLQMKAWDSNDTAGIAFTLLPNEARVIRDALKTLFQREGLARLWFISPNTGAGGVHVTSRTYTIQDDGGTYGFLMPPLNNFQSAAAGETLEILGVSGEKKFRTNIGLVEVSSFNGGNPTARIEIYDATGNKIDSFSVTVPAMSGMQLNDIFRARGLGEPEVARIRVTVNGSGILGAYATVTDNGTNDSIYLAANLAPQQ